MDLNSLNSISQLKIQFYLKLLNGDAQESANMNRDDFKSTQRKPSFMNMKGRVHIAIHIAIDIIRNLIVVSSSLSSLTSFGHLYSNFQHYCMFLFYSPGTNLFSSTQLECKRKHEAFLLLLVFCLFVCLLSVSAVLRSRSHFFIFASFASFMFTPIII